MFYSYQNKMTKRYSFNKKSDITVWVDLDNSPHVLFFFPIIREIKKEGYNVLITARKHAQTINLAELYNLDYIPVGKHFGKIKLFKLIGLFIRALQLIPYAKKNKVILALSHGSRSQMITSALLKIPSVVFLDYEFVKSIPFVKPDFLFLPSIVDSGTLKNKFEKILTYDGIKENIYIPSMHLNPNILTELGIDTEKIIVVVRPPATDAHYHDAKSDKLFERVVNFLNKHENVVSIILPRTEKQKKKINKKWLKEITMRKIVIPSNIVDGLNLINSADLVIGGGGTMNREAAVLGVPVYSIFQSKIGAVDKHLAANGKLKLVSPDDDLSEVIELKKLTRDLNFTTNYSGTLNQVKDHITGLINSLTNQNSGTKDE